MCNDKDVVSDRHDLKKRFYCQSPLRHNNNLLRRSELMQIFSIPKKLIQNPPLGNLKHTFNGSNWAILSYTINISMHDMYYLKVHILRPV